MVPAPTACTEAEAPPPRIRIAISIPILVLIALNTEKTTNRLKEMMYIVRRPRVSENDDLVCVNLTCPESAAGNTHHHRGKMDMESM